MGVELSEAEVRLALQWANGCDGESFIDEHDWPLVERLSASLGEDPARHVPGYAEERRDGDLGMSAALNAFQAEHGRWPNASEQMTIRYRLERGVV